MTHEIIKPESLGLAKGFSHGVLAQEGRTLFVAGQVGWDKDGKFAEGFAAQWDLALANSLEVVRTAGGAPEDVCRMTTYVTDKRAYLAALKEVGASYRARMGKHFPAMALVQVAALVEDKALVEIEATAVIPRSK
jgi:enamine deaminase RidA (YjgF/YER057c/UK114 family)